MLDVINRTAGQVFMPLTVGGGISTVQDIRNALNAGADKISVNTAAVKIRKLIADGAKLGLARQVSSFSCRCKTLRYR